MPGFRGNAPAEKVGLPDNGEKVEMHSPREQRLMTSKPGRVAEHRP